jgi:phage gp36-like protein
MLITFCEYIERFGGLEFVRVTNDRVDNPVTTGDIDGYCDGASPVSVDVQKLIDIFESTRDAVEGEVYSYVHERYGPSIPFSLENVPLVLKLKTADLIRFELHGKSTPSLVEKRRDNAVAWLSKLASSKVSMGTNVDGEVVEAPNDPQLVSEASKESDDIFGSPSDFDSFVDGSRWY